MRLSDAIALGRAVYPAIPGKTFTVSNSGDVVGACAIGMAKASVGHLKNRSLGESFPWTINHILPFPCECLRYNGSHSGGVRMQSEIGEVIAHIFDDHIFIFSDWTLDQLIDWVRQNEPPECEVGANESPNAIVASVVTHPELIPESIEVRV